MTTEMENQENNVEKSSQFKSLESFGKTISSVGWGITALGALGIVIGLFKLIFGGRNEEIFFVIGIIVVALGFLVVIAGQAISCMVAIARHTETTNNILTRHTEILEALQEKC
tara:strand:- start:12 stop:350 length:339 start_codon:yes stop_codon:yes gene_type:complete